MKNIFFLLLLLLFVSGCTSYPTNKGISHSEYQHEVWRKDGRCATIFRCKLGSRYAGTQSIWIPSSLFKSGCELWHVVLIEKNENNKGITMTVIAINEFYYQEFDDEYRGTQYDIDLNEYKVYISGFDETYNSAPGISYYIDIYLHSEKEIGKSDLEQIIVREEWF